MRRGQRAGIRVFERGCNSRGKPARTGLQRQFDAPAVALAGALMQRLRFVGLSSGSARRGSRPPGGLRCGWRVNELPQQILQKPAILAFTE